MPPDRTWDPVRMDSPSATLGRPRNAGTGPALQRNQACLTCRARKVRCDAAKPACGACRKTAVVRREDPETIICSYDDATDEDIAKVSRGRNSAKRVAQLENRIAELEHSIRTDTSMAGSTSMSAFTFPVPEVSSPTFTSMPTFGDPTNVPVPSMPADTAPAMATNGVPGAPDMLNFSMSGGIYTPLQYSTLSPFEKAPTPQFLYDHKIDPSLYSLLHPNWPEDLPGPLVVHSLCELFFRSKSVCYGMVNQARFMTCLTLPPTHANFPSVALIHAICGVACLFNASDALEIEKESYWRDEVSPAEYHLKLAKVHIDDAVVRGRKLFQVAQAIVLSCFCSYSQARFVEVWLYTSLATRISTPLGLNHLEGNCQGRQSEPEDQPMVCKPSLLDPPSDEIERYERAVTFWLAFCCDRFASANTGWAQSLAEEDITTLLPNEMTQTSSALPSTEHHSCLDIRSPDFLSSHPPVLVRSQGMLIKSIILLSRIHCFLQRAPYPIGHRTGVKVDGEVPDLRDTPAFKRLDADAVAFRLSFPRDLRNAFRKDANGLIDSNLVLAHQVAHTSTILLHEPWCTTDPHDSSMQRCMSSAKAILAYLVHENAAELALLNPFITWTWTIAGRTIIRQLAVHEHNGAKQVAAGTRMMIDRVLAGLTETARSPLSLSCAEQLKLMLDDLPLALPRFGQRINKKMFEKREAIFDIDAPPPMFKPGSGGGIIPGMNLGARPPRVASDASASNTNGNHSDATPSSGTGPMTPGKDANEASSAFLFEIEREQQANGKPLTAEEIKLLLEPWIEGSIASPSAAHYLQMMTE